MIGNFLRRKIRTELRAGGFTDLIVAGLDATVRGQDADALVTGALEAAAGFWARAMAAADVTGTDALTDVSAIGSPVISCVKVSACSRS